ncbi:MAG: alpha/beta fold hydrolase [Alphaproteobacteria bacterium]|nr:alpha/beta fold hydrolase [Alphaproteobacteria bacterium]
MAEINGKTLALEVHGDGTPLVMVHGLGGTSNAFYPQAALFTRWFKLIRLDLEGSGRSALKGKPTIESFVDDVIAAMDSVGANEAHFVGHSMGTIICQHIAAKHAKRVKSLALLGPLAEPPEPARAAIRARAEAARKDGMTGIADTLVNVGTSAETKTHRPATAAFVREILMRQSAEGYAATCEALAAAKAADATKIICPTLLITGDEDATSPPPAVQRLAQSIKGSKMIVLNGCGHWTPIEKPAEVNAALVNFYFG